MNAIEGSIVSVKYILCFLLTFPITQQFLLKIGLAKILNVILFTKYLLIFLRDEFSNALVVELLQ